MITKPQHLLSIVAMGLICVSCGKIRELASKAKRTAETKVSEVIGSAKAAQTPPDPRLQALVDQTPEGAVFRKDLPFPEQLQVKVERRLTFESTRFSAKSALGNQALAISGTRFFTTLYERAGDRVAVTMESAGFAQPEVEPAKGGPGKGGAGKGGAGKGTQANGLQAKLDESKGVQAEMTQGKGAPAKGTPAKGTAAKGGQEATAAAATVPDELTSIQELTGGKVSFLRQGKAWKAAHSSDFKRAVWGGNLEPHVGAICIDAGVLPRAYWFGKRRLKPGDTVPLAGAALPLLLGEGASGALELKLESFEASSGHPCGVFAVTGNYRAAAVPGPDGEVFDNDVSISSGKVWLSLIYPIVIREQLETVQTIVTGARRGPSSRIQGKVSVAVTREWKQTGSPSN
jgi:hypothetical protein